MRHTLLFLLLEIYLIHIKKPTTPLLEEYQEVEAFGKIIQFPIGMSKQEMHKIITDNEHKINPDYKTKKPNLLKNLSSGDEEKIVGKPNDIYRNKVDGQWKLYCLMHNIEKLAHHGYAV